MVNLIVVYECPIKEAKGYKEPDIPIHISKWKNCKIKTTQSKTGEIKQSFIVESEMEDTEFEKIKDLVKVVKVMKL